MNVPLAPAPDRVRALTDATVDEVSTIALVIKAGAGTQRHVGILHKDPDDARASVQLLDLRWHHEVGAQAPRLPSRYLWAVPSVEPEIAYVLAKLCKKIADQYVRGDRRLAYALKYAGATFDRGAGIFMNEAGRGLTCATFVMAVFASHGAPLLHWAEWQPREEDRAWQAQVVQALRDCGADEGHVTAVNEEAQQGATRFRPEEVAAAGVCDTLPLGFTEAERIGKFIVERLPP